MELMDLALSHVVTLKINKVKLFFFYVRTYDSRKPLKGVTCYTLHVLMCRNKATQ